MNNRISEIIKNIGENYRDHIQETGRHYLEVNLGQAAARMGITDLPEPLRSAEVVVPLKEPMPGMKVRIDGRTFVDYARFNSGLAAPGYVARAAGLPFTPYVAHDSMVLNFV